MENIEGQEKILPLELIDSADVIVTHKSYLPDELRVRQAKIFDIPKVVKLLDTSKDCKKVLEGFRHAVCSKKSYAYVIEVISHQNVPVVGVAIASDEKESEQYEINYNLDNHTYYDMHGKDDHAYMHHFKIFPTFQRFNRQFLRELLRLMNKTCFYHRIYPDYVVNETTKHQSAISGIEDWIPLMPRRKINYTFLSLANDEYDFQRLPPNSATNSKNLYSVVYYGTKHFALQQRIVVNKRIVFVGASETTLSCIETMLSGSFLAFKKITIVDPHGLPGQLQPCKERDAFFGVKHGGKSMSFDSLGDWINRMGLKTWVTIVNGKVTSIDRDEKYVIVNRDERQKVFYDTLVIATGLQFQRIDCPEPEINDPSFLEFKKKTNPMKYYEDTTIAFMRDSPKPENVFTVNTEYDAEVAKKFIQSYLRFMRRKKTVVIGGGLKSYACIRALIGLGIPGNKIVLIVPSGSSVEWEQKSGYILTDNVKFPMEEALKKSHVKIIENYDFHHWDICPITGFAKRTHYVSNADKNAMISVATFAVFCYRYHRVDDEILSAMAESFLLFHDGIIIDEHFKTNDPHIYAAGPATTYKKILLAAHQEHRFSQSEEVGQKLAEFIMQTCGNEGDAKADVTTWDVPKMKRPFVRAVELLGGWHYMYMRSPGAPLHLRCFDLQGNCDESCECTTEIVTGSIDPTEDPEQKFFKLWLDDQYKVIGIECMSKKPFSASNFQGLYGQHEVLLNRTLERLEKGETEDLYEHFCQPWFAIFCCDAWENFKAELAELYNFHDIGDGDTRLADFIGDFVNSLDNPDALDLDPNLIRNVWEKCGLKHQVEIKLLTFLKFHKLSLPIYARNDYMEELLRERASSPFYGSPQIKF